MIDKNKTREAIEKASVAYSGNSYDYREGFKAGINWFLKNLWHPMSDKPEMGSEILILRDMEVYRKNHFGIDVNKSFVHEFDFHDNWDNYADDSEYKGWLYIENLMNDGKLNLETLEIEKPEPRFKDGDIVFIEQNETFAETVLILRKICNDKLTVYAFVNCDTYECYFDTNKYITIDNRKMRKATDSERQYLFKHLAKEGKRWNAETKTLEDLPKKCEFKPKDWCLMRKGSIDTWHLCQYSDTCDDGYYGYYAVGGNFFKECIHYNEQTKHLLGTTDDYEEGGEK